MDLIINDSIGLKNQARADGIAKGCKNKFCVISVICPFLPPAADAVAHFFSRIDTDRVPKVRDLPRRLGRMPTDHRPPRQVRSHIRQR